MRYKILGVIYMDQEVAPEALRYIILKVSTFKLFEAIANIFRAHIIAVVCFFRISLKDDPNISTSP